MGGLEVVEVGLVDANGLLELLDVFRATFSEGGLSLAVPLLSLLGRGIDLAKRLAPTPKSTPMSMPVPI